MSPYQQSIEIARLGKALVAQLFVLLKTSMHYTEGHVAVEAPVARVLGLVHEIQKRTRRHP